MKIPYLKIADLKFMKIKYFSGILTSIKNKFVINFFSSYNFHLIIFIFHIFFIFTYLYFIIINLHNYLRKLIIEFFFIEIRSILA